MKIISGIQISGATLLLLAVVLAHFINFVFNAFLGRVLTFEEFGLVALINTFWYLALIPFSAIYATLNYRTAYLTSKENKEASLRFLKITNKKILSVASIFTIGWLISTPLIDNFFQISNYFIPLSFTPIIILGVITAANKGYLQGIFSFKNVAGIMVAEPAVKLFFAWFFVSSKLNSWVYLSIPISVIAAFLLSIWFIPKGNIEKEKTNFTFPKRFFTASIVTGLASMAFLTFDLILAKHFLSSSEAGQYALLALIGKMVYFFGTLPSVFILTFVSRDLGKNINPNTSFYKLFIASVLLVLLAFILLGPLGKNFIPLVFGDKSRSILPYLTTYCAGIGLFAISGTLISFHLAKQQYLYPLVAISIAFIMSFSILLFHENITQITQVIFYTSLLSITVVGLLHILDANKILILDERII